MSGSCRCGSCPIGAGQPGHFGGPFPCCQGTLRLLLHRISPEPDASRMLFWGPRGVSGASFPPAFAGTQRPASLPPGVGLPGSCSALLGRGSGPRTPEHTRRPTPSHSESRVRALPGPPGLSGLLTSRGVSPERIPPSPDQQDPNSRTRKLLPAHGSSQPWCLGAQPSPRPFSPSPFSLSSSPLP